VTRRIRTIVVGVASISDQDPHVGPHGADPVLAPAVALAAALGAALHVVHVFTLPDRLLSAAEGSGWESRLGRVCYARAVEGRLEAQLSGIPGGAASECHAVEGSSAARLCGVADEVGADLIIVGASRRGRMWRAILGATAARVLRASRLPVLVVHQPFDRPIRRVVMGVDLTAPDPARHERAMDILHALAPEAEVRAVHVVDVDPMIAPPLPRETLRAAAGILLSRFLADRRSRPRPVESHVRVGDVAQELSREVDEWEADLLVLGTQGRFGGGLPGLGSTAASATRHAPCNVLMVPEEVLALDLGAEALLVGTALFEDDAI
jgi:universal stress protein E